MKAKASLLLILIVALSSIATAGTVRSDACQNGEEKVLQIGKNNYFTGEKKEAHVFSPDLSGDYYNLCMDSKFDSEIKDRGTLDSSETTALDITEYYDDNTGANKGAHIGKPGEYQGSGEHWSGEASHQLALSYNDDDWSIHDVSESCNGYDCRFLLSLDGNANAHAGDQSWADGNNDVFKLWVRLNKPPEVYISFTEDSEGNREAQVICEDDTPACDTDSYRLRKWDSGNAPASCPENYNDYNLDDPANVEGTEYFCAAAKDEGGEPGFSATPRNFESGDLRTSFVYDSNQIVMTKDDVTYAFYRVENTADEFITINASLSGVNATFTDYNRKYTGDVNLEPDEVGRYEVEVNPEQTGTNELVATTENKQEGLKQRDSIIVNVKESISTQTNEVPGIGPVHLLFLMLAASAVHFFRM